MMSKKNMQARSSVTLKKSTTDSPQWTSAKDIFKSPKSPSPIARRTRRTSVYHSTAKPSEFKMPASKIVSPPGLKAQGTRRSSIYQRNPGKLLSPPTTRARCQSMYVSSNIKQADVDFFSKVWATPGRQPEPIQEDVSSKLEEEKVAVSSDMKNPLTKKPAKTPKSTFKQTGAAGKTPRVSKASLTLGGSPNESSLSPKNLIKKNMKTPKSTKKAPVSTSPEPIKEKKDVVATSIPSKSLEDITGMNRKSFYGTRSETPIASIRTDDVFVFAAVLTSLRKSARKTINTPRATPRLRSTPKKPKTLPKSGVSSPAPSKMSARKTPGVKRKHISSENSPFVNAKLLKLSPVSSPKEQTVKSAKKVSKKLDITQVLKEVKIPLSPIEMSTVIESARKVQKRKASESPSPRPNKHAKVSPSLEEVAEPRVVKIAKRTSPPKLAEFAEGNQSNSATVEQETTHEASFLNETFTSDSRSSRCTIL